MPLVGEAIPQVPLVSLKTNEHGFYIIERTPAGDEFYLLECGHRVHRSTVSEDGPAMLMGAVSCGRCWERLLGTEEAE